MCKIAKWHFAGTGAPLDQIDANARPPPEQQWLANAKNLTLDKNSSDWIDLLSPIIPQ